MSKFETSTDSGRKEFIMEELRLCCDLVPHVELKGELRSFLYDSGMFVNEFADEEYHDVVRVSRRYLEMCVGGDVQSYILMLMDKIITEIAHSNHKDYLIKHACYIIKNECCLKSVFRFLHTVDFLIEQRRLRLL